MALSPGRASVFREKPAHMACSDLACHPRCVIEAARGLAQALGQRRGLHLWVERLSQIFVDMVQNPHEFSQKRGNYKKRYRGLLRMVWSLLSSVLKHAYQVFYKEKENILL